MASQHNAEYLAHEGSTNKSDSPYFQNNGYSAFGMQMPEDQQAAVNNQGWNYQPGQLDIAPTHSASVYQSWQDHAQHLNFPSNVSSDSQNHLRSGSFPDGLSEFQGAEYAVPETFDSHQAVQYDNSLIRPSTNTDQNYGMHSAAYVKNAVPSTTAASVALQSRAPQHVPSNTVQPTPNLPSPKTAQSSTIPDGHVSGGFIIIEKSALDQVVKSTRLHNFVDIGHDSQDVAVTKTTLPPYHPRKSRNEIKKLVAGDIKLSTKIAKKATKKGKSSASKRSSTVSSTGQAGSPKRAKSQSSSDDSSDDSASESEDELVVQAPLPPTRPTSAKEAVRYDSIKALWRDPAKVLATEDIRKGLADFWEVVRTIRDRWKSDAGAVKDAEEAKKTKELPFLKERVADQRFLFEAALKAAMEHSHREILQNLGLNSPFVFALSQFLQDRAKDADYNGGFSVTILELLSKCTTMTDAILEKTMLGKILPRFAKRGDDSVSKLAKAIPENAAAATKRKKDAKPSITTGLNSKEAKSSDSAPKPDSPVAGSKRARPSESSQEQPPKRIAGDFAKAPPAAPAQAKVLPSAKKTSSDADTKSPATTTSSSTAAPKEKHVVAKPSGFFSSLQSAKKPATAAKSAATGTTSQKPGSEGNTPDQRSSGTTPTSQPKPSFSFAETMANLTKPKEVEPSSSKKEDLTPPETDEERAKRLRKEERRKLRVTFKPEGSLIDIRYFTHDPEEELGHDENQVRDVGDIDSEGRMFKLKHQEDMMDIDEDDDDSDEESGVDFSRPYPDLIAVDFSTVPEDERERNYDPHGGGFLKPDCPERWLQERREASTLLVVYAQASDIPPSPKEVTEQDEEEAPPLKSFGPPSEKVLSRVEKLKAAMNPTPPPIASARNVSNTPDLSAIFGTLRGQPSQSVQVDSQREQGQSQAPNTQTALTDLEKIFAQFSSGNQPTQQLQPPSTSHYQQSSNQFESVVQTGQYQPQQPPFQQDQAGNMSNLSSLLASLQQSNQLSHYNAQSSGYQNDTSAYGQYGQQQNIATTDFQAAAYQNQQYQPQQQQQQQQQQPQQQPQQQQQPEFPYENEERKHWRESGGEADANDSRGVNKRQKTFQKSGKYSGPQSHIGPQGKPLPFKVVQCKYWMEGRCRKGSDCTFLHEE